MLHNVEICCQYGIQVGCADVIVFGDKLQLEFSTGLKFVTSLRDINMLKIDEQVLNKTITPKKIEAALAQCPYPAYKGGRTSRNTAKHTVCVRWFGGCEEICQAFSGVTILACTNSLRILDYQGVDNSFLYNDLLELSVDGNIIEPRDGEYSYDYLEPILSAL